MKVEARWIGLVLVCLATLTSDSVLADQIYRDPDILLSFRYPDGWQPQSPQLGNTRVLLYATDGSLGTCNVNATARSELAGLSPERLRAFNAVNHKQHDLETSLRKFFPDLQVVRYWRGTLGYQDAGYIEFDHAIKALGQTTAARSVVAATFSNGHWFAVTCNAPRHRFAQIYPAFEYIAATLIFMH